MLAPSTFAQGHERSDLPSAPVPKVQELKRPVPHPFYDRAAKIELGAWAAAGGFDVGQTCHNLTSGGHEDWMPAQSCGAMIGVSLAGLALEEGIRYGLHRSGHHKLERFVIPVAIAANIAGVIYSKKNHGW